MSKIRPSRYIQTGIFVLGAGLAMHRGHWIMFLFAMIGITLAAAMTYWEGLEENKRETPK